MNNTNTPLILENFDDTPITTAMPPTNTNVTIIPQKFETKQLVVADRLSPKTIASPKQLSIEISSKNTAIAREISGKSMAPIKQNTRSLLNNVRMNDMDTLGATASSIIDGIKILRLDDLKKEAHSNIPAPVHKGIGNLFDISL